MRMIVPSSVTLSPLVRRSWLRKAPPSFVGSLFAPPALTLGFEGVCPKSA